MVEILDNFLPENIFKQMQGIILSNEFPWYYSDYVVEPNDGLYQLCHLFVYDGYRPHFPLIEPCVKKLGATKLARIKANLNPRTTSHVCGGFHIDDLTVPLTSIFYVNTNNGWTKFEDGCKVECIENRMVIFDSNIEHSGFTCIDDRKVIINFNYGTN